MKKILFFILIFAIIAIAACQQAVKKETQLEASASGAPVADMGNAAVDAVGQDLNSAAVDEKALSADNLTDIDSGLSAIQNS